MTCDHAQICLKPSRFSSMVGYRRPSGQALFTAATGSRKRYQTHPKLDTAYPPPLILPGDDLAEDPKYPPQSFGSWLKASERNAITPERKTIYVAASPAIDPQVGFMQTWLLPRAFKTTDMVAIPSVSDISHYLQAFYHGLSVKILPNRLNYVAWSDDASHQKKRGPLRVSKTTVPRYVGLEAAGSVTRIRTRHLEDAGGQPISAFAHQLNLDDILDCAVSILPEDAYALIILVDHDIYEDEDDDFCCGRAYGASRIAVVSSAQYNPCLDQAHHIDREHCWPASHCLAFLDEQMRDFTERQEISGSKSKTRLERHTGTASSHDVGGLTTENSMLPSKLPVGKGSTCSGAMTAAIQEHRNRQAQNSIKSGLALQSMYLLRIARTASHELGHCLGMDHCTYYACAMQGTASTNEDSRQPPFLCPVCLNKLAHAVVELNFPQKAIHGEEAIQHKRKWLENRHQKMRDYSIRQEDAGFASLAAWTAHILEDDPLQTVLCY